MSNAIASSVFENMFNGLRKTLTLFLFFFVHANKTIIHITNVHRTDLCIPKAFSGGNDCWKKFQKVTPDLML